MAEDPFEIEVKMATSLARYTEDKKVTVLHLGGKTDLLSVVDALERKYPELKGILVGADLEVADSINIYVNGENIRYLEGLKTVLKKGDFVNIIPAAAAG
jgi:molybdopterin synthase sulfur carrier subunit